MKTFLIGSHPDFLEIVTCDNLQNHHRVETTIDLINLIKILSNDFSINLIILVPFNILVDLKSYSLFVEHQNKLIIKTY